MVEFVDSPADFRDCGFPVGFDEPAKGDQVTGDLLSPSYADDIGDLSLSDKCRNEDGIILSDMILEDCTGESPVCIVNFDTVKPVIVRQ